MKKILGVLAGAAIVAAAPAHATNGMRMIGFGPVQNSMGGAGVAAPLDSATVVLNPAGLGQLGPRLDLAAQSFMPSVEYSTAPGGPAGSSDRPTDFLPTLGGVYRVQDQLTLGFAALGTAGMGVEYAKDPAGSALMTSYLNGRVAPAAAYRVTDRLTVGLALNLMYAQMEWNLKDPAAPVAWKADAASAFGYGATVGVSFQVNDLLSVGAAYETKSFFQDFDFETSFGDFSLDFDQPQIATLGVAVRPVKGLLLAVDGQWINWSDVMGKDRPKFTKTPPGPFPQNFDMRWDDQLVVKVGVQYALPSLEALKLRAGYDYGAMPLDKENAQANLMFPALSEHHFTVGAGYDVGRWGVNAAFLYSPEASLASGGLESRMSQVAFELGGAYRF